MLRYFFIRQRLVPRTYRSLLTLVFLCIICFTVQRAWAAEIKIVDKSISVRQAIDGQTFTLMYKIDSSITANAVLGCTLHGPNGVSIEDDTHETPADIVTLQPGVNWYQRDFFLNVPPGANTGLYTVEWGVDWGTGFASASKGAWLNILPPYSIKVPILMYHKVGPVAFSEYWVSTAQFTAQMKALKAYGYTAVTLGDIMRYRAGLTPPPAKPVVITFDDGFGNLRTDALPVLQSIGMEKATSFLPTGLLGGNNSWDPGDDNPVIPMLTWDDVTQVYQTGLVDFESHTVTHPDMPTLGSMDANRELVDSAAAIRTALGYRVLFISWPFGDYTVDDEKMARAAGYFAGIDASGGVETSCLNKWGLKRVYVDWNASTDFDKGNPNEFFFNMIKSGVAVPILTISSISYYDADTGVRYPSDKFPAGKVVDMRVKVTNSGPTNTVIGSAQLALDAQGTTIAYDSHIAEEDNTILMSGSKTLHFYYEIPPDAPSQQFYIEVSVQDVNKVLGFAKTNPFWQQAFSVVDAPKKP